MGNIASSEALNVIPKTENIHSQFMDDLTSKSSSAISNDTKGNIINVHIKINKSQEGINMPRDAKLLNDNLILQDENVNNEGEIQFQIQNEGKVITIGPIENQVSNELLNSENRQTE